MGGSRGCRSSALVACLLALLFLTSPLGAQGVVFDGDALFRFWNYTGNNTADFRVDANLSTDHLYQHWFWYRQAGDLQETRLPAPTWQTYILGVVTLTWFLPDFDLEIKVTLTDGPSPGVATAEEVVTITNTSGAPLSLDLFVWSRFALPPQGNVAEYAVLVDPETMRFSDTGSQLLWTATGADHYQVMSASPALQLLNDTTINDLDDSGLPTTMAGPAALWQYTRQIPVGATEVLNLRFDVTPPVCPTSVQDLRCTVDCATDELVTSWVNTGNYDEIIISVDGVETTLPGTASSFSTPLLSAQPTVTVTAFCGGLIVPLAQTTTPLLAVTTLTCERDPVTGLTTVNWHNPATFDDIVLTLDGVQTLLPGTAETYSVTLGTGNHTFSVAGTCGGITLESSECQIAGVSHVIWAAESPGDNDSVLAVEMGLDFLGQSRTVLATGDLISYAPFLDPNSTLWVMAGTFPNGHDPSPAEEDVIVQHILAGGHVYIEGDDLWGFQSNPTLWGVDGIDQALVSNGADDLVALQGLDFQGAIVSDFSGATYQSAPGAESIDRIPAATTDTLGPNAGVIWREATLLYPAGVYYDTTAPHGKVWSQSWELGGFGGDQIALVSRIVDAFGGPGPIVGEFLRGDANGDGSYNIADAVAMLWFLFQGVQSLCLDAADATDDGSFNIADPIRLLSALIQPVIIPPPSGLPHHATCGTDPTFDTLGCESYTACP